MQGDAFFDSLKKGSLLGCYLFSGEEEFGKETALSRIKEAICVPPMGDMNLTVLENPDVEKLIAVCETLPLMADRRLVVVKESPWLDASAKEGGADADKAAAYVKKLPDTTCLVFFVRGAVNRTRKLYKAVNALGGVVDFELLDQEKLIKWIAREMGRFGKKIARDTAGQLILAIGNDLHALRGEIGKLAAFAGERESVESADIEQVCTLSVEYRVFDLADAVAMGQSAKAVSLMNGLLLSGEARLMLLSLLQRQFRNLLMLKILTESGSGASAAQVLALPPFAVRKLSQAANRFSRDTLLRNYRMLIEREYQVKSGQIPEEGVLEEAVLEILDQSEGKSA